jgi:hypothetical protein
LAFALSVEQKSWIEAEGHGITTWTTQHARDKVLRQSASQRHSKVGSRKKQIASPDKDVIHQKSNRLVSHNDRVSKPFHPLPLSTSRRLLIVSNILIDAARLESVDVRACPTVFQEIYGVALPDRAKHEIVVAVRLLAATNVATVVADACYCIRHVVEPSCQYVVGSPDATCGRRHGVPYLFSAWKQSW